MLDRGVPNFPGNFGLRLLFAFVAFFGIGAVLEIILSPVFLIDRWFITPTMPFYAGYLYVAEFARYPLSLVALCATAFVWAAIGSNSGQLVVWLRERARLVVSNVIVWVCVAFVSVQWRIRPALSRRSEADMETATRQHGIEYGVIDEN